MTNIYFKRLALLAGVALLGAAAAAETCTMPSDMSAEQKSALEQVASRMDQAVISGDANTLRAAAIPSIAQAFDKVADSVNQVHTQVTGGQSTVGLAYALGQDQQGTVNAEFYCGVLNDPGRVHVVFSIPSLPPGTYAFVMTEVTGGKTPYNISYVFQQEGGQWKMAGFYPKPLEAAGHDGLWYWQQARTDKTKGQTHNAYLFLLTAQDLLQPVRFMTSTTNLDKLFNEQQAAQPPDVPVDKPVTFAAPDGKSYQLTQMFPTTDDKGNLVLVVKYAVPDVSNGGAMFQQNQALANALVAKYPELKPSFASVVPRATAPSGQDFGSEFKMADLK